ncbi:MAG TPA: hypothetical protein VK364_01110 [Hymenobacter sp.]|nr:hypothetical protein [Hymenobacter sp.]
MLPVAAAVPAFKHGDASIKTLALFFLLVVAVEATALGFALRGRSNMAIYNYYLLIETPFWLLLLRTWCKLKIVRAMFVAMAIAYVFAWLLNHIAWGGIGEPSNALGVARAVILTFAAGTVLLEISQLVGQNLFANPRFWIASGVLIFFSVNAAMFSLWSFILRPAVGEVANIWFLHSVLNILANTLYTIGLLCISRKTISS